MTKIALVESVPREAERLKSLLGRDDFEIVWCDSRAAAERVITPASQEDFAAGIIRWEISEPQLGFQTLLHCRKVWPNIPIIVVSATLDAAMVTRAFALGAKDFLAMPLDSERVRSCLKSLLKKEQTTSPLLEEMKRTILGQSSSLLAALHNAVKVIPRRELSVLIVGQPGTGKELFAQAIHELGPTGGHPLVPVNIGAVPATLIESLLFGFERGAFTGATERRAGYLEQANNSTLFLDEIGELDLSLQVKLLRVLQEKQFWRLGGKLPQTFNARMIFATNRDLAKDVNDGTFRRDLYDRITEVQIQVPPLSEREGDVDLLADHFLSVYDNNANLRWMPDTLAILRSYSFPGNVRELQNVVKAAVLACEEDVIRPRHLPLMRMGAFAGAVSIDSDLTNANSDSNNSRNYDQNLSPELLQALHHSMPPDWLNLSYREAVQPYEQAFDRIYLAHSLKRHNHNVTRAAAAAGIDAKTFRKRWRDCGLPALTGVVGDTSDG